jgi:hypothetical protein
VAFQQNAVNGDEYLLDPDSTQPTIRRYWRHRAGFRLNSYQARTGDLAGLLLLSDFYSEIELKRDAFYVEYLQGYVVRHSMSVSLPAPAPAQCHVA